MESNLKKIRCEYKEAYCKPLLYWHVTRYLLLPARIEIIHISIPSHSLTHTHILSHSLTRIYSIYLILSIQYSGPNRGTSSDADKIVIIQKPSGGPNNYGESTKVSVLSVGQTYALNDYKNSQYDILITFVKQTSDLRDATITVYNKLLCIRIGSSLN